MGRQKGLKIEKTVLIALLSSIAAVGRVLLAGFPSVQPSSFIIIMAGICFGKETAMMTGIITALSSNLVMGQGPWTPWQMFAWGLMGWLAGLFGKPLAASKILRVLYGFVWGFIFGWIMNLWYFIGYDRGAGWAYYITAGVSSFYFDLAHGMVNALLLVFAGDLFIRAFCRIGVKYGITGYDY